MAKSLSMDQLKQLAAHGARARVEELRAEIAAITRAFPEVADSGAAVVAGRGRRRRGRRRGRKPAATAAAARDGRRRGRRRGKLSDAGRAAISAAQKKRWAAIKKQKAKAASA